MKDTRSGKRSAECGGDILKGIYGVLAFAVGAAVGGYSGYIFAKDYYLKQADEELKSMEESYEKKFKKLKDEKEDVEKKMRGKEESANAYKEALIKLGAEKYREGKMPESSEDGGSEKSDTGDDKEDHPKADEGDKRRKDLAGELGRNNGNGVESREYDRAELEFPVEDDPQDYILDAKLTPEIINEDQWAEEYVGIYDKVTLNFYPEDVILCTEDGELIDNIGYTVGNKWLLNAGDISAGDEFYVRNGATGTDYQIIICAGLGSDHLTYED